MEGPIDLTAADGDDDHEQLAKRRRVNIDFLLSISPPDMAKESETSVSLSWTQVAGAIGYSIRTKSDKPASQWGEINAARVQGKTATLVSNLLLGSGHLFSVRPAFLGGQNDDWGWSGPSRVFEGLFDGKKINEVFRDVDGNFLWEVGGYLDGENAKGVARDMFNIPRLEETEMNVPSQQGGGGTCSANYAAVAEDGGGESEINLMFNYRVQSREKGKKQWSYVQRAWGFFRPKTSMGLYLKGRGEHDWDSCLVPQRETTLMKNLRETISAQLAASNVPANLNTTLINCYEDHCIGIAAHSDESDPLVPSSPIVTLSPFARPGDRRDFVVRSVVGQTPYNEKHNKTAMKTYECSGIKPPSFFPNPIASRDIKASLPTTHGQLIVMGGPSFQQRYKPEQHGVCGPRISLTLREYKRGF